MGVAGCGVKADARGKRAPGRAGAFGLRPMIRPGRAEGRARDRFVAVGYLAANPDLAAAFGTDADAAALHCLRHGWAEGREDAWA